MTATENPCVADRDRRERATRDNGLTEQLGSMVRSITFDVGYDHRAFPEACGGGGHGQSGMTMRFILRGPHGATQWIVYLPNWVPGNLSLIGGVGSEQPWSAVPARRQLDDGMAWDLGYHSPKPIYDDQHGRDDCNILPGGSCYYDGSGVNAGPVLEAFLAHGPHAVWAALADYYSQLFGASS